MDLQELATLLQRREDLIADRAFYQRDPEAHLEALKTVSTELETWETTHQGQLDSVLAHYLERRSYTKALAYCRGDKQHRI